MLRIILAGCHGRMGRQVVTHCKRHADVNIVAGVDRTGRPSEGFPVFSDIDRCYTPADVLIDFSHPEALDPLLAFCTQRKMPILLAVTGYSQRQLEYINHAIHAIPVFRAANLSVGANVLQKLTKTAAAALGTGFDVNIIERHHKRKADAPSGTALTLSLAIGMETAISSIRAGTTAGEHTVLFAGRGEVIELTHRADSREVYAAGAIRAARYIAEVNRPGLYGMDDLWT